MNNEEAKQRAHEHLCSRIELSACSEVPQGVYLYNFDPAREYLFRIHDEFSVGGSTYVVVDRGSGEVRHAGFHGE